MKNIAARQRFSIALFAIAFLVSSPTVVAGQPTPGQPTPGQLPTGHLMMVGGGGTPPQVIKRLIRLAGGPGSKIVVTGLASKADSADTGLVAFFRKHGSRNVEALDRKNVRKALEQIREAKVIWLGGGSQNRLVKSLPKKIKRAIASFYKNGGTVGGTSAGAAAMSTMMLSGIADLGTVGPKQTELVAGLGLTPLIVDQHFNKRQRFNRLLSAVLDNRKQIGIGIDEQTAVLLTGNNFEVLGQSNVCVIDARQSTGTSSNQIHHALNIKLHVIKPGESFSVE